MYTYPMTTLAIILALVCAGGVATLVGTRLIERVHRPRGRFIDVGGFPQHVIEMGEGGDAQAAPPIVLLHGAGSNLEDMHLALGKHFGARRRVIFVDRPGLGFSARRAKDGASPAYQAAVLRAVLDRLGVARAILVGHSWGGTLALAVCARFPRACRRPGAGRAGHAPRALAHEPAQCLARRTRRLAVCPHLAFPFGAILMWPGSRTAFLPQTIPEGYVKRSAAMLVLRPPTLMANWADVGCLEAFLERQAERYPRSGCRRSCLAGDRDPLVPAARHGEKLAAAAPGVKLIVLPGFGHMLHHAAADQVVAAVEEVSAGAGAHEALERQWNRDIVSARVGE